MVLRGTLVLALGLDPSWTKMSAAFYKYISKDSVNPYELYTLTLFSTSVSAKTPTPILYLDLILTALKSSDLVIYKFWQPIFSAL